MSDSIVRQLADQLRQCREALEDARIPFDFPSDTALADAERREELGRQIEETAARNKADAERIEALLFPSRFTAATDPEPPQ